MLQTETPDTLRRKMDEAGARLMAEAVAKVRDGETQGQRQPSGKWPLRTRPTRLQVLELSRRGGPLERLAKALPYEIVKRVFYLLLWKLGVVGLMRRLGRKPQAAILLYHRVDDFSDDPLTISRRGFAEHLSVLKRFYTVKSSEWLVERLEKGESIGSDTVVLHFDDCYESVASAAAPLLRAAGLPATSFINSGFIDTARRFGHDERKYALDYANMSSEQVRGLESQGVGVAAHTVNHVDMGAIGPDEALRELRDGREALEGLLGREVKLFSFPYGRPENVNARVIEQAKACGYRAVFSAHGGYVEGNCDLYDIPRIGISQYHSPLELLLVLEGLTLSRVKQVISGGRN